MNNKEYKKSLEIINELEEANFDCYFVGGCVRDQLLGIDVNDFDLVTNASTEEVLEVYKGTKTYIDEVGKNFGVLIVNGIELAQYRTEFYEKVSKPTIKLSNNMEEDSKRRDFTINSMYMDKSGKVIDFNKGKEDLNNKVINCVGDVNERFKEDPSRILRAIYLKSKLNFSLTENLKQGIVKNAKLLNEVPKELVGKIVLKVIKSGKLSEFMEDAMELGLMNYIFTELNHLKDLPQNPLYHCYDAWNHTLAVVRSAENKKPGNVGFILGALYHDCAKGLSGVRGENSLGQPNDIGHEIHGGKIAYDKIIHYGFGKEIAFEVRFYVAEHGVRLGNNLRMRSYVKWLKKVSVYFRNKDDLRKGVSKLFDFVDCDADGFGDNLKEEIKNGIPEIKENLDKALNEFMYYYKELPVNGEDVIRETGVKGVEVGKMLDILLQNNVQDKEMAYKYLAKNKIK